MSAPSAYRPASPDQALFATTQNREPCQGAVVISKRCPRIPIATAVAHTGILAKVDEAQRSSTLESCKKEFQRLCDAIQEVEGKLLVID
jgi:hypothetical protein